MLQDISKEKWLSLLLGGKSLVECSAPGSLGPMGEAWYYILQVLLLCVTWLSTLLGSTCCGLAYVSGVMLVHSLTHSLIHFFNIYMAGMGERELEVHDEYAGSAFMNSQFDQRENYPMPSW